MQKTGLYQSATISISDLSEIERLASHMENINGTKKINFNVQNVQRLNFIPFFPCSFV